MRYVILLMFLVGCGANPPSADVPPIEALSSARHVSAVDVADDVLIVTFDVDTRFLDAYLLDHMVKYVCISRDIDVERVVLNGTLSDGTTLIVARYPNDRAGELDCANPAMSINWDVFADSFSSP